MNPLPPTSEQIELIQALKRDLENSPDLSDTMEHRINVYEGILQNLVACRLMQAAAERGDAINIAQAPYIPLSVVELLPIDKIEMEKRIKERETITIHPTSIAKYPLTPEEVASVIPGRPSIGKSNFVNKHLENIDSKSESYHFGHGDRPNWMLKP